MLLPPQLEGLVLATCSPDLACGLAVERQLVPCVYRYTRNPMLTAAHCCTFLCAFYIRFLQSLGLPMDLQLQQQQRLAVLCPYTAQLWLGGSSHLASRPHSAHIHQRPGSGSRW